LVPPRRLGYSIGMPGLGHAGAHPRGSRRRVPTAAYLTFLASTAYAVASCALPADTLGTYDVTGTLGSDTCDGAPNPWVFPVMLMETDGTLYWNWLDASPLLSGPVDGEGVATLSGQQLANVDATDAGMGPCDLTRTDALTVTLGEGSPPGSFRATLSYTFTVQEGATCTDQLASSGGMYARLPCTITYTLAARRQ
jgi:hypothetical protein